MIGYARTEYEIYRKLKIFFEDNNSHELINLGKLEGIVCDMNEESFPLIIAINDNTQPTINRAEGYGWKLNIPVMLLQNRDFIEKGINIFEYTDSNLLSCELTSIDVDNFRNNLKNVDVHYINLIEFYDEFLKNLK